VPAHKPLEIKGTVSVAGKTFPATFAGQENFTVWDGADLKRKIIFRARNGA